MEAAEKGGRQVVWLQADGRSVSCEEKLKVLNENLAEIRQLCQDAFEDAVLMGCDESQIRSVFTNVMEGLHNPYARRRNEPEPPPDAGS